VEAAPTEELYDADSTSVSALYEVIAAEGPAGSALANVFNNSMSPRTSSQAATEFCRFCRVCRDLRISEYFRMGTPERPLASVFGRRAAVVGPAVRGIQEIEDSASELTSRGALC